MDLRGKCDQAFEQRSTRGSVNTSNPRTRLQASKNSVKSVTKSWNRYVDGGGTERNYGLVQWKDRDIVYALTNCVSTQFVGVCYRRSAQGRILLERPKVIK